MELKPIAAVIFFLSLMGLSSAQDEMQCPTHEEFRNCSSTCEPTCQDTSRSSQYCVSVCKVGCFCKKGFIREGPGGPCVAQPCKDEIKCIGNTQYSVCASVCPKVCNSTNTVQCQACSRGCECKSGYIRDQTGKCISEEDCLKCGKNRSYKCGLNCPLCSNPKQACAKLYCSYGCFCEEGYLWDDKTLDCVKKEKCPPSPCG